MAQSSICLVEGTYTLKAKSLKEKEPLEERKELGC